MVDIFEIRNNLAYPTVHTLLVEPFKTIWEQDTTHNKGEAIRAFTYVDLVCNMRKSNPFASCSEKERPAKVRKQVWGDENYKPDNVLQIIEAVIVYKSFLTEASASYQLYCSAMKAVDSVKEFLDGVDLTERTKAGTAVYKPTDITRAVKEVPEVIKSLQALKETVNSELQEASKTRNQRQIGIYER